MDRSRMIVACARLVLDYEDNARLMDALERRFPPGPERERAHAYVWALGFMDVESGRGEVQRVLARHKSRAA